MTIKQQGGIFGRNPEFNDVNVAGNFTVDSNTFFVDAVNNRVGVGTNSPQKDIVLSGETNPTLRINNSSTAVGIGDVFGSFEFYGNDLSTNGTGIAASIDAVCENSFGLGAELRFSTRPTSASDAIERMRVDSVGNVEIKTGNLVIGTSGNGIDFSATSGTGTSELFDDYEEGQAGGITLTPETSGSFTMNAALDTLAYTKVGRLVSITGMISCTNVSAVGTFVELDGLPFASADLPETSGRFAGVAQFNGTSGTPFSVGYGLEGWTKIRFPIDASTVTGNIVVNINYIAA